MYYFCCLKVLEMKRKFEVIKCPHCQAEYLPAEIYLPNSFLGRPYDIDKEGVSGEIRDYFGTTMDLQESYICDKCNQPFRVFATVQFNTKGIDFNKDYKTKIRKESLFLEED